ncbi:MAG: tyrosine-type recombinase/integrase [Chloroflexi bacterium]|nr:tyrosine-type recombinase/integrase [Chloroflexota bacterium]
MITIRNAFDRYLEMISLSRSENTYIAYSKAIKVFSSVMEGQGIDPDKFEIKSINEDLIGKMATYLKQFSAATEQLYLIAVKGFYQYLLAEELASINLQRLQMLIKSRSRRLGQRLPQFPKENIEKVIEYDSDFVNLSYESEKDQLINFRDAAFIITLADTGMRVHEMCNLRRGDLDWNEFKALIIGKGDSQAIVRFSSRSFRSIKSYLSLRSSNDGKSGKPLPTLPIFSRHDKGAGEKILSISPSTGRNIINRRVKEILGENHAGTITPHSFRHYFVTNVLIGSGGNLKLAQELARHKNIQVTQRYAHLNDDELDKGYHKIFEE